MNRCINVECSDYLPSFDNGCREFRTVTRCPKCVLRVGHRGVVVDKEPHKLSIATLCRLMDDCLPEQIEDERDMQALIYKLWPALCCEFGVSE